MEKIEFYAACDRLLGQTHPEPKTYSRRGRWGPREPGSGRYEGYGLIRWISPNVIHLALRHPRMIQKFSTPEEVLKLLATIRE